MLYPLKIVLHVIVHPAIVLLNWGLRYAEMKPGSAAVLLSNCFSALVNGELTDMVEISKSDFLMLFF